MSARAAAFWAALLAVSAARAAAAAAGCTKPPVKWHWESKKGAFSKVLLVVDRPPLATSDPLDSLEKYRPHFWDLVYVTPGQGEEAPWVRPPEEQPQGKGRRLAEAEGRRLAEAEAGGAAPGPSRLATRRLPHYGCQAYVKKDGSKAKDSVSYACLWMIMRAAMGGPIPQDLSNFRPAQLAIRKLEGFLYMRGDVWLTPGVLPALGHMRQPLMGLQAGVKGQACRPFSADDKRHESVKAAYAALQQDSVEVPEASKFVCSMWNEMVYIPKGDANQYGKFAAAFVGAKVIAKTAMPTILAGMYGVQKAEDAESGSVPSVSYLKCFDSGGAAADDAAFDAWPCGHKIELEDPCHRRFVSEVWSAEGAPQTVQTLGDVAESSSFSASPCRGKGGFYLEIDRVTRISGTLGHPHVHRVEFQFQSGLKKAYGGSGGDAVGPWTIKPDEFITSVLQCDSDVGTLGRSIDFTTSKGRVLNVREPDMKDSACGGKTLFRAPEGRQIVGLVFKGSKLTDVLTPVLISKELSAASAGSTAQPDALLGVLATPMGASAMLVPFLAGATLTRLYARVRGGSRGAYMPVASADAMDEPEVFGRKTRRSRQEREVW